MLKYALLGILRYSPMSGYDLEQFISTSVAYFWNAKLSQIYRTLKQMEEKGLARSYVEAQEGRPDRRVYEITAAGQAELDEWLDQLVTELDEAKVPFLVRFFFYSSRPTADVQAQLKIWRDLHQQRLAHFRHALPQKIEQLKKEMPFYTDDDELFWEATRRLGEMFEETYVRWLEETMMQVEQRAQGNATKQD